jgi:hypothetical protein
MNAFLNRLQSSCLVGLEHLALRSKPIQRWMVFTHRRAFQTLLAQIPQARLEHVVIVGGGMFPRTLLILLDLLPRASFTVIEKERRHIEQARLILQAHAGISARIHFVEACFLPGQPLEADALVLPLAFLGHRTALYQQMPTAYTFVHDWLWQHKTPKSARVSCWLLKRINLVENPGRCTAVQNSREAAGTVLI